jgi:hypothetical protein
MLDAFKPPLEWLPEIQEQAPQTPEDQRTEQFRRAHKLSAVITGPAGDAAVIAGRTVLVGQQFEGFKLVSIGDRRAVFQLDDLEVVLTIAQRSGGRSGADRR